MKLIQYIRLIRFKYHITFIVVIIGALVSTSQPLYTLIKPLLIVYLSFNVLLYGGLYTLNDIVDIKSDSKHPKKKNRPLPSKSISITSAYIFAFAFIFTGLIIAYFSFGINMFLMYLSFILVNQIYTRIAKKIPYVEILFNSLTYPMRFFLGVLSVTGQIYYFLPSLMILLFAFGVACGRRVVEKKARGWQARQVLQYYNEIKLMVLQIIAFGFIIIISIIDYPFYNTWHIIVIVLYLIFVFGIYFSNYFLGFYQWIFLN
jgi:4-hydroxybenzoate polyprenyltransferase